MDDWIFNRTLGRLEAAWLEPPDDETDWDADEDAAERIAEEQVDRMRDEQDELRWGDWA